MMTRYIVLGVLLFFIRSTLPFEWTALGDSYASGVGSTNYVDGSRCPRYDKAYPIQLKNKLDQQKTLGTGGHIFHNAVCSGAETKDVEAWQLLDEDTWNQPGYTYGYRPKFGDPSIASLTVGGDDIDFPGILFNCILEFHIWGGPTQRSCDEQRNHTWSLLKDPALVDNVDQNIKKVVAKGRNRTAGGDFKLYVTGYPQFFNQDTSECNNVTFARTANPNPDGKEHSNMTTELRTEFNNMSKALKAAVQSATLRNTKQGVTFIDIETNSDGSDALSGHRFCELGIKEPDQNNPNLWFWHYPYSQANDDTSPALSDPQMNILIDAYNRTIQGLSTNAINSRWPSFNNLTNAVYDSLNERRIQALGNGTNTSGNSTDPRTDGFWDWIGFRVKVFHPQVAYHTFIMDGILQAYLNGSSLTTTSNTTNISTAASSTRFHRYAYIP